MSRRQLLKSTAGKSQVTTVDRRMRSPDAAAWRSQRFLLMQRPQGLLGSLQSICGAVTVQWLPSVAQVSAWELQSGRTFSCSSEVFFPDERDGTQGTGVTISLQQTPVITRWTETSGRPPTPTPASVTKTRHIATCSPPPSTPGPHSCTSMHNARLEV